MARPKQDRTNASDPPDCEVCRAPMSLVFTCAGFPTIYHCRKDGVLFQYWNGGEKLSIPEDALTNKNRGLGK